MGYLGKSVEEWHTDDVTLSKDYHLLKTQNTSVFHYKTINDFWFYNVLFLKIHCQVFKCVYVVQNKLLFHLDVHIFIHVRTLQQLLVLQIVHTTTVPAAL